MVTQAMEENREATRQSRKTINRNDNGDLL